jgi:dGTPase
VEDIINTTLSLKLEAVRLSDTMLTRVERLRSFLFERVYELPAVHEEFRKVHKIIHELFDAFIKDDDLFVSEISCAVEGTPRERQVCDFIAGMTDRYTLELYKRLFLPRPWMKV